MKARHGNFIDNPYGFDHEFFNISPREAKSMDPQQKILLQRAVHAMDDARYVPHATPSYDPCIIGCYIGIATEDYVQNLARDIDVYYSTGEYIPELGTGLLLIPVCRNTACLLER